MEFLRVVAEPCVFEVQLRFLVRESAIVLSVLTLLLAGCASSESGSAGAPRPGTGAAEYRKLVTDSEAAVLNALHWLDQIATQTNGCPPKLVSRFSREVE